MADLLDFTKPYALRDEAEYNAAVSEINPTGEAAMRL